MYGTSTQFHTLIKDGVTPQIFLLRFLDSSDFISSEDGDFTTSGVTIGEVLYSDENMEFGVAPSYTLSCVLENTGRRFAGLTFGEAKAFIGVQTSITDDPGAEYSAVVNATTIVLARDGSTNITVGGVTIPGTANVNAVFADAVSGYCYAVDNVGNYGWKIKLSDSTYEAYTPTNLMRYKADTAQIVIFGKDANDHPYAEIRKSDRVLVYELCPMGIYNLIRPTQTNDSTVEIVDAFDRMKVLDRDATPYIAMMDTTLTYPLSIEALMDDLIAQVGMTSWQYPAHNWYGDEILLQHNPFTSASYTFRDIVMYCAEATACYAVIDRDGVLTFRFMADPTAPVTAAAEIPASEIVASNYDILDYTVKKATELLIKFPSGEQYATTIASGAKNTYTLIGNPFIDTVQNLDSNIPDSLTSMVEFHPITAALTEHDPSLDCGDYVQIGASKNLLEFPYTAPCGWVSGVLWDLSTEHITATGTNTGGLYSYSLQNNLPLEAGTYTLSIYGVIGGTGPYLEVLDSNNVRIALISVGSANTSVNFTLASDDTVTVRFTVNPNVKVALNLYVMLQSGAVATGYEGYGEGYLIPIMERTVYWNGKTTGEIVAKGLEYYPASTASAVTDYNGYIANQRTQTITSGGVEWTWQKFSSGLVFMTGKRTVSGLNFTANGSVYSSGADSISATAYPITFSVPPTVFAQTFGTDSQGSWLGNGATAGTETDTPSYEAFRADSASTATVEVVYTVVGYEASLVPWEYPVLSGSTLRITQAYGISQSGTVLALT